MGRRIRNRPPRLRVTVSSFVPKAHTPCQWSAQDTEGKLQEKHSLLQQNLQRGATQISWHDTRISLLEAVLSRGDRRLGAVIQRAWQLGARFDGWSDQFRAEAWRRAFGDANLDPAFYVWRTRPLDEVLPWDHLDAGVSRKYLVRDYQASLRGETRPDCRAQCHACGILTAFRDEREGLPAAAWACPPVE